VQTGAAGDVGSELVAFFPAVDLASDIDLVCDEGLVEGLVIETFGEVADT
jgi:hypothetical protein